MLIADLSATALSGAQAVIDALIVSFVLAPVSYAVQGLWLFLIGMGLILLWFRLLHTSHAVRCILSLIPVGQLIWFRSLRISWLW